MLFLRQLLNSLDFLDDELKSEYASTLELTQTFLNDDLERIKSNIMYTLNKREK